MIKTSDKNDEEIIKEQVESFISNSSFNDYEISDFSDNPIKGYEGHGLTHYGIRLEKGIDKVLYFSNYKLAYIYYQVFKSSECESIDEFSDKIRKHFFVTPYCSLFPEKY